MTPPLFDRYLVTLRMTRPAGFRFYHGGAVMGLLCAAIGDHVPVGLIPHPCESGRVRFEPGDTYRIGITLAGEARGIADPIHAGLRRVGETDPRQDRPLPALAGNFQVERFEALPQPDLEAEVAALAALGRPLPIRLTTPLRMELPRGLSTPGLRFFASNCFPVGTFLSRLWGRAFMLANGRKPTEEERRKGCPRPPDEAAISGSRLVWLDTDMSGSRKRRGSGEPQDGAAPTELRLGGLLGTALIEGAGGDWSSELVLGQYLHAGNDTHYGFGAYRLGYQSDDNREHEEPAAVEAPAARRPLGESIASSEGVSWAAGLIPAGAPVAPRRLPRYAGDQIGPSRTLLSLVAEPQRLRAAFEHVSHHSHAPGEDGVTPEAAGAMLDHIVAGLSAQLTADTYRPGRLLGVLVPKRDGGVRALAVPTVRDRIAQRSTWDALAPAIDTLLEDSSYAYRRGRSRTTAAAAIQRAWDEGYRYVLDADIESFFDAVDWDSLFTKLDALLPGEPLVPVIQGWVTAPVMFSGRLIQRSRGLPQGAAISPLLANLVLDELDERLLAKRFRLVRYADDFVVLCRSLEDARDAQDEVHQALAELGLALNLEKTQIRSFAEGFSYLGYLFCRSLVLQSRHSDQATGGADAELNVPAASWLASVPLEEVRAIMHRRPKREEIENAAQLVPIIDPSSPLREPLYVTDPDAELALRDEQVLVDGPSSGRQILPVRAVSHLVLLGHARATVPLLLSLARLEVPTFFCRRTGELYAEFGPHAPDWPVWEQQAAKASDDGAALAFARAIVQAKLHNAATLAVRLEFDGASALSEALRALEQQCLEQTEVAAVRGLEGRGAALFFGALQRSLDATWGFAGRHKHPSPDPVNAMLSFAYTMLYNHISTAIYAAGLHPRIALFHERRGTYHALACDLQEELRFLADAQVIGMIHRGEVHPSNFSRPENSDQPCLMDLKARKQFIQAFERRLVTEFTPPGEAEPVSYFIFIDRQVRRYKAYITENRVYEPLRIHS